VYDHTITILSMVAGQSRDIPASRVFDGSSGWTARTYNDTYRHDDNRIFDIDIVYLSIFLLVDSY
jgi:hypothetical protein